MDQKTMRSRGGFQMIVKMIVPAFSDGSRQSRKSRRRVRHADDAERHRLQIERKIKNGNGTGRQK